METKPRFKNSFGVRGTKGELYHFAEIADSKGWVFSYDPIDDLIKKEGRLYFNSKTGLYYYYNNPTPKQSDIEIASLEGWQRALSLAEEKEEEVPEYVECVEAAIKLTKGKIYKVVSLCADKYWTRVTTDSGDVNGYNRYHLTPSTKEAYDRQELLEEAKRRYPAGTRYKSVPEGHTAIVRGNFIYLSNAVTDGWGGVVYHNEQWAEIIPEEKAPTKEEIERVLNHLQNEQRNKI